MSDKVRPLDNTVSASPGSRGSARDSNGVNWYKRAGILAAKPAAKKNRYVIAHDEVLWNWWRGPRFNSPRLELEYCQHVMQGWPVRLEARTAVVCVVVMAVLGITEAALSWTNAPALRIALGILSIVLTVSMQIALRKGHRAYQLALFLWSTVLSVRIPRNCVIGVFSQLPLSLWCIVCAFRLLPAHFETVGSCCYQESC